MTATPHTCAALRGELGYPGAPGFAIESIEIDADGTALAGNSEYVTEITFCPFCGIRLGKTDPTTPKDLIKASSKSEAVRRAECGLQDTAGRYIGLRHRTDVEIPVVNDAYWKLLLAAKRYAEELQAHA